MHLYEQCHLKSASLHLGHRLSPYIFKNNENCNLEPTSWLLGRGQSSYKRVQKSPLLCKHNAGILYSFVVLVAFAKIIVWRTEVLYELL